MEAKFKVLWANHGDDISQQYAGTGALKSGFTRTGKRTYGGLVDDGIKSLTRYYLNNFCDGRKQDALDLVTGTYRVDKSRCLRVTDLQAKLHAKQRGGALLLGWHLSMLGLGGWLQHCLHCPMHSLCK